MTQLGVVDLEQQLPSRDVLAPLNGALADAPIDPRGDVDAGRIRFALDDERLRPCEIPDRKADNCGQDERHDGRRNRCACLWLFVLGHGLVAIFRRWALFHIRHAMLAAARGAHVIVAAPGQRATITNESMSRYFARLAVLSSRRVELREARDAIKETGECGMFERAAFERNVIARRPIGRRERRPSLDGPWADVAIRSRRSCPSSPGLPPGL